MQITSTNIKYDGDHGIRFARISRHPDYLTVVLDLDENNIITRVEDQHTEGHPKSRQYQAFFKNAIAAEVVGKSLSEVSDLAVVA